MRRDSRKVFIGIPFIKQIRENHIALIDRWESEDRINNNINFFLRDHSNYQSLWDFLVIKKYKILKIGDFIPLSVILAEHYNWKIS